MGVGSGIEDHKCMNHDLGYVVRYDGMHLPTAQGDDDAPSRTYTVHPVYLDTLLGYLRESIVYSIHGRF